MKNKKYLLLLLAVLMAFTLVFCTGCKDDPDEPPLTESPVTTEEPDTAEPDTAEPDTALPDTAQPETDAITTAEPETSEETDDTPSKPNNPSNPSNPTTPDNPPETSVTKPETQEPSAPVYTVVFDTDASGASYSTKSVTTQGAVVFPETPTRSGYTFKGWYTAKNGSGTRLTSGTTVASNTTYYALWSEEVDQRPDRNVIEFSTYDEYSSRAYPLCEEMGFDYIWYRWDHKNEEASIEGLNELYSYGIKACIIDDDLKTLLESGNSTKAQADALTKNYINSPAYWGNWLVDEPGSGPIHPLGCKCRVCGNNTTGGQLLTAIKAFMEYYPDEYFQLNLLPIYAWVCGTPQQLAEAYKNFKDYAGIYADESNVNLVMQDTYPHGKDGKNNVVANHYLLGLSVTAEAARDNNAAHGVYIKTLNEVTQPPITEKSIRFEAFTGLAYGTSKISFFISTSGASGLMTEVGKNATFAYAQEMISDLHSISSVYSKYDWQAACCFRGDGNNSWVNNVDEYGDGSPNAKFIGKVLKDVTANNDVLIGGFNETFGSGYGFCVVNQSNTYALRQKTSEFKFKIDGSVKVVAYLDGEKGEGMKATTLTPDSSGYYNISIPVGDGVFFTVSYGD